MRLSLFLLILPIQLAFSQSPVTRDQMSLSDRVSKKELVAGYQIGTKGWIIRQGDTLLIGRGSMPDSRYAFIYESLASFTRSRDGSKKYLSSAWSGQRTVIKELFQFGTKSTGYTMIAKVGMGNISNYWVELDNAYEKGEIVAPSKFKSSDSPNKTSTIPLGVAEEIKKLKELLDSGVITKEEFENQKRKLLNN